MNSKQKVELIWDGKEKRQYLEPRVLVEDSTKSYHAKIRHGDDDIFDNMLIHGDNLLALKALEHDFAGKVKCIYIDPPYNTGNAFDYYDDGLEHSIWLNLMRERLEILKHLLSEDGSIWISIDEKEGHYLKVLCDEIFGRHNFVIQTTIQRGGVTGHKAINPTPVQVCDYMLTYAKNKDWTTPELAIQGGASFLKGSYIGNFQDTLYLQKYSVDSSSGSLYGHQYQQNISAPYTEGLDVYDAYEELGILESNFNFIVPIYENMPESASTKPGRTTVLTTENVVVQTLYTPLRIRVRPSISSNVLAEAPRATVLVRIEKANEADENGYYWDTVAYNNGTKTVIGYASREYLGEIATAETLNEAKTIGVMCNLRNGPGTSNSWVKKILPVGTQVTVIDKINYKIDGLVWCRVKLSDGTQGYVAENFFQAGPVEKYKIDGENIIIAPNTAITDIPKATLVGDVLGTGAKVKVEDKEYTLVVKGDCNGDGVIDSADLLKVVKHLKNLSKVQIEKAADTNNDGIIDSADLLKIVKHLKGLSLISI